MPGDEKRRRGLDEDAASFAPEDKVDEQIEHWLNSDVASVYDKMIANPDEGISLQNAISGIRAGLRPG